MITVLAAVGTKKKYSEPTLPRFAVRVTDIHRFASWAVRQFIFLRYPYRRACLVLFEMFSSVKFIVGYRMQRVFNGNQASRILPGRHLDESQRAMVAARIASLKHGQKKAEVQICTSVPDAADKLNVSPRTVKDARKVIDSGVPALVAAVESGKRD
jgi:hypothetical protein